MPAPPELPAHVQLIGLVAAKWVSQPIYVLAELGIADLLAGGPRSAEDLAAETGVQAGPLRRCLRAAAAVGVFRGLPEGRYGLTPLGECLRTGVPDSVRDLTVLLGDPATFASFGDILETVRTGEPAFPRVHGMPMFSYLDARPEFAAVYQGAWASLSDELGKEVDAYDFSAFRRIADLGGGHGRLLAALLRACPDTTGVLVDRADVVTMSAPGLLAEFGERVAVSPGELPGGLPVDADAYVLKNTLHCFTDEFAASVLASVRAAIGDRPDARLVVIETVIPEDDSYDWGKFIDIEVMVNNGGRERTRAEWEELFGSAGLRLSQAVPTTPPQWVLEGVPA
ncbi:O-methyltransferase [Actinomadura barringtoniae]|uniref:O-methyltransferase n=1 Tax=Actinomadura barringtoniae TaxID=1427535 RepID=A0A939TCV0_9ACTN|nr:methyltransferase [Actinomadura barringtoniae]MBO2454942.1 O-methyltransferase [Actinomadura barringtoniae]